MTLSIFSYAHLSYVYLLWWYVSLRILAISVCFLFFCHEKTIDNSLQKWAQCTPSSILTLSSHRLHSTMYISETESLQTVTVMSNLNYQHDWIQRHLGD
jgi:hypothetical protein